MSGIGIGRALEGEVTTGSYKYVHRCLGRSVGVGIAIIWGAVGHVLVRGIGWSRDHQTGVPLTTADYFERNITAQRNQPSQPRKPDGGRVNTPQNNFNRTRRVFGALNEKPYAKLAYQDQPGHGEQKLHIEKPAMKTGDRPRYDQTKNHDHHNHPPGEVCFNCGKLGHFAKDCKQPKKQRAFLRAARTAAPDAASEADDEDTSPEDPDGRDNGRPETEADNEDEGDEFVDMEVYENEYYARDDETERMFAMTEVIASEERNDKPPSRKVKVRTGRDKIARPVVLIKDKECLVTYINVGGHEAWTLWDSGSTTTGLTRHSLKWPIFECFRWRIH
ncbi:hypothetical protein D9615_008625 [Tricholomella constricta]|uniref:CCHC-type domain-containing protein n=1 Tax=Tricholomella constricta TaxID=117010 RepID=A0A8H5H4H1_9AGAR|nr:hypothetical protein D9615_008625 [Tricholomella constricta]